MDLNDTVNDFKETKIKRVKNVSYPRNKLSRNKRQKTSSEDDHKGSQKEKNNSQKSSKSEDKCLKSEVIVECTSSYFSGKRPLTQSKTGISGDTHLNTGSYSSTGFIGHSEPLKNEYEEHNLPIKTESNVPVTDSVTLTNSDLSQTAVASCGERVLQQSVQENVCSTTETSEEWWCMFCSSRFPSEERDAHIKSCVQQFGYRTVAKKEPCQEEEEPPPSFHCEVCKKNITHFSLQDRNTHVNSCIDQKTADNRLPVASHDFAPEARTETINVSECPVCGKQYTSIEARLIHIKKCCKKHKMEPQQVIIALQLQEKHALERIALGLPPLQIKPSTLKTNANPRQRKRKTALPVQVKSDPDLQIAMALSLSLKEEEKRKQEALGLLLGESDSFAFDSQSSGNNRPSVELKPPTANQIPGRTKTRNKKNDPNKPVPTLLLRTEEERLKLLQERVSAIITPGSPPKTLPEIPVLHVSETSKPDTDVACSESGENSHGSENSVKLCELWALSGLAPEKDAYYVPELQEWVSHSEVVAGSKLKSLSQVPGHRICHDFGIDYSTFYTQDSQVLPSSQNCSGKLLMDIPSTQEMLDVITGDDACITKMTWNSHQNSQMMPANYGDSYCGGELKNEGFFADLKKTVNLNAAIPVIDCLSKLVGNPWMSDISITVIEQSVPAHKLLLIPRCPAVEKELEELHNGLSTLDWSFVSLKAALEFLCFIYTGFCQLNGPFKKEISLLFYRYDMAEAYETLKNDSRLGSEEECSAHDVSYECDFDAFAENQKSAKNPSMVIDQETVHDYHDAFKIHSRNGDFVTRRNNLNFTITSSPEGNDSHKDASPFGTQKEFTPVKNFNHHESSSNEIKELREEQWSSGIQKLDEPTNFSIQGAFKNARLSQCDGRSSPKENWSSKHSKVSSQKMKHLSEEHNSDEEIKYLHSSNKTQHLNLMRVSPNDQESKLSISLEDRISSTPHSEHSFNGLGFPRKAKSLPNSAILNISPLKHISDVDSKNLHTSSTCNFYQTEVKKNVGEDRSLNILPGADIQVSSDLLNASDSDASFLCENYDENSNELFMCNSDEEVTIVHNVVPHDFSSISTTYSVSSTRDEPLSHLPDMTIPQKLVPKSPDQEIVILNEVSNTNNKISTSFVYKPLDFQLGTEIDGSYQNDVGHKEIHNSTVERTCQSSEDESLPDLHVDKHQICSSATLLSTPTSSKRNKSVMQQKRKLLNKISPVANSRSDTSFKKIKIDVQKTCSPDLYPVLNIEDEKCIAADNGMSYRRDISVNKNSDQSKISDIVTSKSKNMLSNRKSFPPLSSPTHDDIDDSDAELEGLCASNRNMGPDLWEGFDDDGFKDSGVNEDHNCNENNDFQLLTPLKSSRNRPPTPHPSSARKSAAKKLSFVDKEVSPLSSPLHTGTDVIDLDSSPILMRPLAERLGVVKQKKVLHSVKITEATELCSRPMHEENKINSKKETNSVSHAVSQCITPDRKTSGQSKTAVQNFTVSTSPITPMPSFQQMVTPELRDQLKKYGIRALPRKKAVSLLTHIYDETHPWQPENEFDGVLKKTVTSAASSFQSITSSSVNLSPKKQVPQCKTVSGLLSPQKAKKSEKPKTSKSTKTEKKKGSKTTSNFKTSGETNLKDGQRNKYEGGELNISSSQSSSFSESSDFPEESVLRSEEDSDDEHITSSQSESLEQRISNYIFSDESLYSKILMYEPLNLSDLQLQLKQHGIKVGHAKLMDYLDEKCITFTLPRSEKQQKKQQARTQRFRKRMITKLSQAS